jgi:hypothetical protein
MQRNPKLDFLPDGEWKVEIFADDPKRTAQAPTAMRLDSRRVARGDALSFDMVDEGGAMAIFSRED